MDNLYYDRANKIYIYNFVPYKYMELTTTYSNFYTGIMTGAYWA